MDDLDLSQADITQATTWGTYSLIGAGRQSTLWTIHDAARAERIRTGSPQVHRGMQALYAFARTAGSVLASSNLDGYLDIGAGVPQGDYLHDQVSATTPVLYNDNDPAVVAKSRELLAGHANVRYTHHDIRDIDAILAEADEHFDGRRMTGVHAAGVLYFVDDAVVRHVAQRTFEWCAPGSLLAFTGWRDLPDDEGAQRVHEMYRRQGIVLYGRTIEETYELLAPWQPYDGGLLPIEDYLMRYHGIDIVGADEEYRGKLGIAGFFIRP